MAKTLSDQLHENLASHSLPLAPLPESFLWRNQTVCFECISFAFWRLFRRERLGASWKIRSEPRREVGPGFMLVDWSGFGVQLLVVFSTRVRACVVASINERHARI